MLTRERWKTGLTLTEVLVACFILTIGLVSLIALFPVGLMRVRQAVVDTRSTLLATNATHVVRMMNWADDAYLLNQPPVLTADPATPPSDTTTYMPATVPPEYRMKWDKSDSAYRLLPNQTGYSSYSVPTITPDAALPVTTYSAPGFPVYVDPHLVNANILPGAYPRVDVNGQMASDPNSFPLTTPISEFGPVMGPAYQDLPIYSLSDVLMMPTTAKASPSAAATPVYRRDSYIERWFTSDADMLYDGKNPVIPLNPRRADPNLNSYEFFQSFTLPGASATIAHRKDFSWSFLIRGRDLVPKVIYLPKTTTAANPTPHVIVPPEIPEAPIESKTIMIPGPFKVSQLKILVFYKRNVVNPFALARGCFFNNSSMATISWPVNASRPPIRRGTWLMEYTNTGGFRDNVTGGITYNHRQWATFHRVIDLQEPVPDPAAGATVNWLQVVTLEKPFNDEVSPSDFPSHNLGDQRTLPDRVSAVVLASDKTFPIRSNYAATNPNAIFWVPVILWDGLAEVFEARSQ